MKRALVILLLLSWVYPVQAEILRVDVPAPDFSLRENAVLTESGHYTTIAGMPKLPCRRVTIAVPPDAVIESVEFHGVREAYARMEIAPLEPTLPMSNRSAMARVSDQAEERKARFYDSTRIYPEVVGEVLATGALRKYSVVEVACYHFAYRATDRILSCSPTIEVEIRYTRNTTVDEERDRERIDDTTFDDIARETIFNWYQSQGWYQPREPVAATGYLIILPTSLQGALQSLADHRRSQGFSVRMTTVEYIDSNVEGIDLAQKIRNYLRGQLWTTQYVLLVGTYVDIPMRELVPFNNDPNSPYNDFDISPIPSDFYYSELSKPDSESWNSDGDAYYGEVYDQDILFDPDDNPEYFADVHLARIPYRTASYIEDICSKIIAFDTNTDMAFKSASLLAGGMIYYERENYSQYERMDGAEMLEQMMDEGIFSRENADYLYEEEGLDATRYGCTAPLTRENIIGHWDRKGVVLEYNHGAPTEYRRKIWAWDDGDGIAESFEIEWPEGLAVADVYDLDNDYPATTFLRSCLCSKPEVDGLAKYLLYRGASSTFGATRILWASTLVDEGLGYHLFNNLLKETALNRGIVGKAFDSARIDFMEVNDFWINLYLINHYGDPALRQFGRVVGNP